MKFVRRLGYRLRQARRALHARLTPNQAQSVRNLLGEVLWQLFAQLSPDEQYHAFAVWQLVLQNGNAGIDLQMACLLHDVGKIRSRMNLLDRGLVVLLKKCCPGLGQRTAHLRPQDLHGKNRWLRGIVVAHQHPQWGAELTSAAGAPDAVVWLIANHQSSRLAEISPTLAHALTRLQSADELN